MALQSFSNQEYFDHNYAGLYTLKLEKDALERLGAQDGICMVCLKAKQLFPKLRPWEIHFCPRRFCEDCVHIPLTWLSPSEPPGLTHACKYKYNIVCCWLCENRGWDKISPLLGSESPQWSTEAESFRANVSQLRWHAYQRNSNSNKQPGTQDDGTPESDRQILKSFSPSLLKPDVDFVPLPLTEPPSTHHPDQPGGLHAPQVPETQYLFDLLQAFQGACQYLLDTSPEPQNTMSSNSLNGTSNPSSSNRRATAQSHPTNPTTTSSPSHAEIPQEQNNPLSSPARKRVWEQRFQMMKEIARDETKLLQINSQLKSRVMDQGVQLVQKQTLIKSLEEAFTVEEESKEALSAKAKESEIRLTALAAANQRSLDQLQAVIGDKDREKAKQKAESQQQLSDFRSKLKQAQKELETAHLFNEKQDQTVQSVEADKKKLEERVKEQSDVFESSQSSLRKLEDKIREQRIVVEQVDGLETSIRKKDLAIQAQQVILKSLQSENGLQAATIDRLNKEVAASELENLRSGKELERYQDAVSSYDTIMTKVIKVDGEFQSQRERWETATEMVTSDRDRLQRELADLQKKYDTCFSCCEALGKAYRQSCEILPALNCLNNLSSQGSSISTEKQTKDIQILAERYQQLKNAHLELQAGKLEAGKVVLQLQADNGRLQTALTQLQKKNFQATNRQNLSSSAQHDPSQRYEIGRLIQENVQLRQRLQNGSETLRDTESQEAELNARHLADLQNRNTSLEGEISFARGKLIYLASHFAEGEWDPEDAELFAWIAGLAHGEDREMSEAPSC